MGTSTFTGPVRAGAKPYLAGSARLVIAVDGENAGVKGTLPAGAIVLGGVASGNGPEATVGTVTVATVTAGVPVSIVPEVQADPAVIEVTSDGAAGVLYIEYLLHDPKMGAQS